MLRRSYGNLGLSTMVALALPKCPLCLAGFLGVLSLLGISASAYMDHLPLFTGLCLALPVLSLSLPPGNRRLISPLPLGMVAAPAAWLGKFAWESDALFYGGIVLLLCAGLWNGWRNRPQKISKAGAAKGACCTTSQRRFPNAADSVSTPPLGGG